MKSILLFLFGICLYAKGQDRKPEGGLSPKSSIHVKGNQNIIQVIQGTNNIPYDLSDPKRVASLRTYIRSLCVLKGTQKEILKNDSAILSLLKKATIDGIFSQSKFSEIVEENTRLRRENEQLKHQSTDQDYVRVLEQANKKLLVFDNPGYQEVLEQYKQKKLKQVAEIAFLQSQNNLLNDSYGSALSQINQALEYDSQNPSCLLTKTRILLQLEKFDEAYLVLRQGEKQQFPDSIFSELLTQFGTIYYLKGKYDSSRLYANQAILAQEKYNLRDSARLASLYNLASQSLHKLGNYDTAIVVFNKALQFIRPTKDSVLISAIYNNLGLSYNEKGDFRSALELYKIANKYQKLNSESNVGNPIIENIGLAFLELEKYDSALAYFQKALTIEGLRNYKNLNQISFYLINAGNVYQKKRCFDSAMIFFDSALSIRSRLFGDDHPGIALCLYLKGLLCSELHKWKDALHFQTLALPLLEKFLDTNHPTTRLCRIQVGEIYFKLGKQDSALRYLLSGVGNFDRASAKNRDKIEVATAYSVMAEIYRGRNSFEEEIDCHKKAAWAERAVLGYENDNTLRSHFGIAEAYIRKGEISKAREYCLRIAQLVRDIPDSNKELIGRVHFQVGSIFLRLGERQLGLSYMNKSIFGNLDQEGKIFRLYKTANDLSMATKFHDAVNFLTTALDLGSGQNCCGNELLVKIYFLLAKSYCHLKDWKLSRSAFQKALEFARLAKLDNSTIESLEKEFDDCQQNCSITGIAVVAR